MLYSCIYMATVGVKGLMLCSDPVLTALPAVTVTACGSDKLVQ